jgi:hypothetical protein
LPTGALNEPPPPRWCRRRGRRPIYWPQIRFHHLFSTVCCATNRPSSICSLRAGKSNPSIQRSSYAIATTVSPSPVQGHVCTTAAGDKVISPLPVALVEGRRRTQWCPPSTTDSLGARKAKVLHQVNQVVAQSKIRRHPVDRFYARHFDLRRGRCRRFGRPHRRRLLRMCCKRPCRSHASKQADELASPS